jgi:DUF2934 family protein/pentapeptide repeat protein
VRIWLPASARSQQCWLWLKRKPLWSASGLVAVILLILLIADWKPYSKHYQAFTPIFTLAAGLAVAGVTLMRQFAQTDADRQRRITESFSNAIEQLGSDKLEVRLGGIYALERISNESPRDYLMVMENLTALVRERTRHEAERLAKPHHQRIAEEAYRLWENAGGPEGRSKEFWSKAERQEAREPATDIAAVLTVITRRSEAHRALEAQNKWVLDFQQAVLRYARLEGAHLERANLRETNLEGVGLEGAHLKGANLGRAHLEGANLIGADLEGARLSFTRLAGANLWGAHLDGVNLTSTFADARTRLPDGFPRPKSWSPFKPTNEDYVFQSMVVERYRHGPPVGGPPLAMPDQAGRLRRPWRHRRSRPSQSLKRGPRRTMPEESDLRRRWIVQFEHPSTPRSPRES